MKKIDFGQTISILANIGVIAGIVFLAIEIRQNSEALGVQARMERQNWRRAVIARTVDNPELGRALRKSQAGETLTPDERFLLDEEILFRIVNWEIVFNDVEAGLLDEEAIVLAGWRTVFHEQFPGMRAAWDRYKTGAAFSPEFVDFMEQEVVPP